jgi:hypothetical protein
MVDSGAGGRCSSRNARFSDGSQRRRALDTGKIGHFGHHSHKLEIGRESSDRGVISDGIPKFDSPVRVKISSTLPEESALFNSAPTFCTPLPAGLTAASPDLWI